VSTARRVAPALLALAGFAGLVLLLTATSAHVFAGQSDKATNLLEGQALEHGHLLLHGWSLSLDSYWTIDAPAFAVGVLLLGVRPVLLSIEPAFMAAAVIATGILMVRSVAGELASKTGALVAGGTTVVVLLGLPTYLMSYYYLADGFHVGTALFALVAFALLASRRFDWRFVLGVLVLASGMLGDLLLLVYGCAPVLVVGLVAMARERSFKAGASLLAAAPASALLALLARRLFVALGAFTTGPALPLASFRQMRANLHHLIGYAANLLGPLHDYGAGGVPGALAYVHAVSVIVIVVSCAGALWRLFAGGRRRGGQPDVLDDMLLVATAGVAVNFVGVALNNEIANVRYLAPAVLFAAVLSGRMVARGWSAMRSADARVMWRRATVPLAAAGVAAALGCAACTGYMLSAPGYVAPNTALASWLVRHDLRDGLGDYWAASMTTVESGEAVAVRPVTTGTDGRLYPMSESTQSWYSTPFEFLVYETPTFAGVDATSADLTFGPPAHKYQVGVYHVLVWSKPITLAPQPVLALGPAPGDWPIGPPAGPVPLPGEKARW
jgi:hypothetical protein